MIPRRSSSAHRQDIIEDIVESMARTLYVDAYATAVERALEDGIPGAKDLSPGPGGEWMDTVPRSTPRAAYKIADSLATEYEKLNDAHIYSLLKRAAKADDEEWPVGSEYAEEFGHYLAMMALGHGVSWFDDHEEFPLKVPTIEGFFLDAVDLGLEDEAESMERRELEEIEAKERPYAIGMRRRRGRR